jgi:hypothetical protein
MADERQATQDSAENHGAEPTQQTKPKKGEPITIPVPEKADVMAFLDKVAKTPDPERSVPDGDAGRDA